MSETTKVERTITPEDWARTTWSIPLLWDFVGETTEKAMRELLLPLPRSLEHSDIWRMKEPGLWGVMWPGTVKMTKWELKPDGSWLISPSLYPTSPSSSYVRLSSAPPDADVQYGFCPVRWNRFLELTEKNLGPAKGWRIKRMPIQMTYSGSFRMDHMALAAIRLGNPDSRSLDSTHFRELLGTSSLEKFMKDMLGRLYQDRTSQKDILLGRDDVFRALVELVAKEAYPGFMQATTESDYLRFRCALDQDHNPAWNFTFFYPYLYNVVMPLPIFNAVGRNLEKGIPPVIPQYIMSNSWLFNGRLPHPCTDLQFPSSATVSPLDKKLLGGTIHQSNLDLPGAISYWPFPGNPSPEWVKAFVACLEDLGKQILPSNEQERGELASYWARKIPLVFGHKSGEVWENQYAKLIEAWTTPQRLVTKVITSKCDATGRTRVGRPYIHLIGGKEVEEVEEIEDEEGDYKCPYCGYPHDASEGLYNCQDCAQEICVECVRMCAHCGERFCPNCITMCHGCDNDYCNHCQESSTHLCRICPVCKELVSEDLQMECSRCGELMCADCTSYTCPYCGQSLLCADCVETCSCQREV